MSDASGGPRALRMPESRGRYGTAPIRLPGSDSPRIDDTAASLLGCSASHAKQLRLTLVPRYITSILTAGRGHPSQREAFRDACKEALGLIPSPQPVLEVMLPRMAAAHRSLLETGAAMLDGKIDAVERAGVLRALREDVGRTIDMIHALEATT